MNTANKKILILTSETIWYHLTDKDNTLILSPQEWDLSFTNGMCHYRNKNNDDNGAFKPDGILWREGHIVPDQNLIDLVTRIQESSIPTINNPQSTLACMDDVKVRIECLENRILSPHCFFKVIKADSASFIIPGVIKVPDFHGGKAKWMVMSDDELYQLLDKKINIRWGDFSKTGYLNKDPYLSEYVVTEPVLEGQDLRVYAFLDRKTDEYHFRYLEREVREGEWLANVHTYSYRVHAQNNPQIEKICLEAAQILHRPDLIGIDFMVAEDQIAILEINNDVPGLASMQTKGDYRIHRQLLENLYSIL